VKHRFTAEALSDYENAVVYYETREAGLGVRFILEVDELISSMLEFPRMGPRIEGAPADLGIRRCIVQTFGVEIDYLIEDESVLVILAVFHGSREPGFWLRRLERDR
jgi:plasmid stabilization system protein ParE